MQEVYVFEKQRGGRGADFYRLGLAGAGRIDGGSHARFVFTLGNVKAAADWDQPAALWLASR